MKLKPQKPHQIFYATVLGIVMMSFCFAIPVCAAGATAPSGLDNVGFLTRNIWYSKEPFFAGEKIRIYTAVINSASADFTGTVEFYNDGHLIGRVPFSAAIGGGIKEVWMDWVAEEGSHVTTAKIVDAQVSKPGESAAAVALENNVATARTVFVDRDVNKNNVGDSSAQEKTALAAKTVTSSAGTEKDDGLLDETINSLKNATPDKEGILNSISDVANGALSYSNNLIDDGYEAIMHEKDRVNGELAKPDDAKTELVAIDVPGVGKRVAVQVENNAQGKQQAGYVRAALQAYAFILSVLAYVFNNKILLYGFLGATLLITIRFIRERWFSHGEE